MSDLNQAAKIIRKVKDSKCSITIKDVDDVKEVVRKKIMKKRTCRKGFHISGCRCKPLTVVADTSV